MAFPLPSNEPQRLTALREYRIVDTGPEHAYDELTGLAAQITRCPIAAIGIMDEKREWIKAKYGLPADFNNLPREMNVCATTLCGTDVLVVPDLSMDERFASYPVVRSEPYCRFYCGMPLINPEGYALGTLCVIDFKPRELTFEEIDAVRCLSRQAVAHLELRRNLLELERAKREIEIQRERSEKLLSSILPGPVANELKQHNHVTPRFFDAATILFADFEGFTNLAERLEPKGLVDQLDQYFSALDQIVLQKSLMRGAWITSAFLSVGASPLVALAAVGAAASTPWN